MSSASGYVVEQWGRELEVLSVCGCSTLGEPPVALSYNVPQMHSRSAQILIVYAV